MFTFIQFSYIKETHNHQKYISQTEEIQLRKGKNIYIVRLTVVLLNKDFTYLCRMKDPARISQQLIESNYVI